MNRNHIWKKAYKQWLIEQSINKVDVTQAWKPSPQAATMVASIVPETVKKSKRRRR